MGARRVGVGLEWHGVEGQLALVPRRMDARVQVQILPLPGREQHKLLAAIQVDEEVVIRVKVNSRTHIGLNPQHWMRLDLGLCVRGCAVWRVVRARVTD